MPSYTVELLGLELSFKTDADADRVKAARALVEERCALLRSGGKTLSKEKLLAFVALGLADDVLLTNQRLGVAQAKAASALKKIDVQVSPRGSGTTRSENR